MNEAHFMAQVKQLATLMGWRVYHTHVSRHCEAGFPDLFMVRGPVAIAAELKVGKNRPTAEQLRWLEDLAQVAGIECYLWTPDNWPEIEEQLRP